MDARILINRVTNWSSDELNDLQDDDDLVLQGLTSLSLIRLSQSLKDDLGVRLEAEDFQKLLTIRGIDELLKRKA